jgi:hypothetical protein
LRRSDKCEGIQELTTPQEIAIDLAEFRLVTDNGPLLFDGLDLLMRDRCGASPTKSYGRRPMRASAISFSVLRRSLFKGASKGMGDSGASNLATPFEASRLLSNNVETAIMRGRTPKPSSATRLLVKVICRASRKRTVPSPSFKARGRTGKFCDLTKSFDGQGTSLPF